MNRTRKEKNSYHVSKKPWKTSFRTKPAPSKVRTGGCFKLRKTYEDVVVLGVVDLAAARGAAHTFHAWESAAEHGDEKLVKTEERAVVWCGVVSGWNGAKREGRMKWRYCLTVCVRSVVGWWCRSWRSGVGVAGRREDDGVGGVGLGKCGCALTARVREKGSTCFSEI